MNANDHRAAAEDIERANVDLGDPAAKPYIRRTMIENYFGSAFHWIAYGTATKHGQHKENHSRLRSYLNGLGEPRVAQDWQTLESLRNGGWYGHQNDLSRVEAARDKWQEIRQWATSAGMPTP